MKKSIILILTLAFFIGCYTTIHPYYTTPQLDRTISDRPPQPKPAPRDLLSDYILLMLMSESMYGRDPFLNPLTPFDMERIFLMQSLIMNEILKAQILMGGF